MGIFISSVALAAAVALVFIDLCHILHLVSLGRLFAGNISWSGRGFLDGSRVGCGTLASDVVEDGLLLAFDFLLPRVGDVVAHKPSTFSAFAFEFDLIGFPG